MYVYTHSRIYIHIYVYIAATLYKISCCCLSEESPTHVCKVQIPATVFSCHVAVCSSMLQRVAMYCSAWQNSPNAYWTCELQCVAVCCSVLQCVAKEPYCTPANVPPRLWIAVCCSVLQHVAACGSVLQCVEPECIPANVPPRLWNSMAVSSKWVESRECTKFGGNADRCLLLLIGSSSCEKLRSTCCKTVLFFEVWGIVRWAAKTKKERAKGGQEGGGGSTRTQAWAKVCMYVCVCVYAYKYIHTRKCMSVYIYIYMHVYMKIHAHIHLHVCMYKYICMCTCICVCILRSTHAHL